MENCHKILIFVCQMYVFHVLILCCMYIPCFLPKLHYLNTQLATFNQVSSIHIDFLKNGGHLGRHLGFLKTPQVFAKVPGSLINFRLSRTFWFMLHLVRFHGRVPLEVCTILANCQPTINNKFVV